MDICAASLALTVVLVGSASVQAYEVIDTGIPGRNEVFWIDNERVLFPGFQIRPKSGERASLRAVLYVWDLGTKRPRIQAEMPEGGYICYSGGYISYAIHRNGKRFIREGKFGAEKERAWSPPTPGARIDRNQLTCRDMDLADLEKIYPGFFFIPLRDQDGYYGWKKPESTVEATKSPLYYLPSGKGKAPIALPLTVGEKDRVSYSEYLGAYVIEYTPSVRLERTTGKVSILYTTGRVEGHTIPAGPWLRGSVGYTPARPGIVMSSPAVGFRSESDPGDAGVYLVRGMKVDRMIVGFPSRYVAVSPDGCKAAAVVRVQKPADVKATLRIVDICRG